VNRLCKVLWTQSYLRSKIRESSVHGVKYKREKAREWIRRCRTKTVSCGAVFQSINPSKRATLVQWTFILIWLIFLIWTTMLTTILPIRPTHMATITTKTMSREVCLYFALTIFCAIHGPLWWSEIFPINIQSNSFQKRLTITFPVTSRISAMSAMVSSIFWALIIFTNFIKSSKARNGLNSEVKK
jgi:hypothetical protein